MFKGQGKQALVDLANRAAAALDGSWRVVWAVDVKRQKTTRGTRFVGSGSFWLGLPGVSRVESRYDRLLDQPPIFCVYV